MYRPVNQTLKHMVIKKGLRRVICDLADIAQEIGRSERAKDEGSDVTISWERSMTRLHDLYMCLAKDL